ncbi:MAG: type II secretion system protein GspL [Magnetococcales bacterium]|nr:type II secretion system protein GspL [Magnetococcales bacterium]MBF0321764.1 type II secretion system protein GspL [Magnetococcales bacterium]
MRNYAYVHLPAAAGDMLTWVGLEGDAKSEVASKVAAAISRMRVVAVAPGVDVLLESLAVPKTSRRNLAKALPFLLEERVASPLDKLHFSLGPTLKEGYRAVAVAEVERMEEWLATLAHVGIRPDMIVSETLLLPWKSESWTLLSTPDRALLRTGACTGLAMDNANIRFVLDQALRELDQADRPKKLLVLNYTTEPCNSMLPDLPDLEVEESRPEVDPATLLAGANLETGTINLLQGRYGIQGRWEGIVRPFRLTVILAAIWILVKLGIVYVENIRMESQLLAFDARIQEIFQKTFPGTRVVHPEAQMRERMKRMSKEAGGGQEFLNLIVQAGSTIMDFPGTVLERIRYQDGLLDLYIRIRDLEQLNKLKQAMEASGRMQVNIRSAVKQGESVESHLQIKGL